MFTRNPRPSNFDLQSDHEPYCGFPATGPLKFTRSLRRTSLDMLRAVAQG